MKSYKNIANKHIFLKKKHFYLTLLGIVMSVALVTAMMTLMYSLIENLHLNAVRNNGAYHLEVSEVSIQEAHLIANQPEVESSGIVYDIEKASAGRYSDNAAEYFDLIYKVLDISICNEDAFSILPFQLEEGTYPKKPNEIIVDRWFIQNYEGNAGIGSVISLPLIIPEGDGYIETENRNYLVTGIIHSNANITTGAVGRAAVLFNPTSGFDENVTAYIRVAKNNNITKFKETISDMAKPLAINENNSLIGLEARDGDINLLSPVFSVGLFLAVIIIIATVAVIYNSFNISVLEKTSLYGLLRTTGATPRQIRKLVYREASFYAAIGIPLGTLIGLGVTYILLEFVGFEPFNLTGSGLSTFISPWFVLAGISIGILTIYASAYIPAVRAGKTSPLEAISQKKAFSIGDPSKANRSTMLGKIAGLPGTMAAKNLIRNKKSFRITIFSIIVSSILFIVFNTLVVFSIDNSPYVSVGFDYLISSNHWEFQFTNLDILYIKDIAGVENVYAETEQEYLVSFSDDQLFYPTEIITDDPLLIVSQESLNSLSPDAEIPSIYIDVADNADLSRINNELSNISHAKPWYRIEDIAQWEMQNRKLTTQLYIFFYGFLAVIIMIGSLNIINTINTSLIQRRREFAIFRSVGMTNKQLSGMVLIETLIQGVKAGIIGSVAGVLLIYILYKLFGRIFDMAEFIVPWSIIGITMGAAIIISILSCISPMKKLGNQDIVATIRSME